jgi:hypothetical protein
MRYCSPRATAWCADERRFLLSLVANQPEWPLLEIAHLEHFPAIR